MLILNSSDLANEILDKKSSIYSDRLVLTMIGQMVGYGWTFSLLRYGAELRENRRMFYQRIGTRNGVEKIGHNLETETFNFFNLCCVSPTA